MAAGLGLLLLGIRGLSSSLSRLTGTLWQERLLFLARSPLRAVAAGVAFTALTQSSSVTTILLLGMVESRLLDLSRAAAIAIGANIGTTLTAHWMAAGMSQGFLLVLTAGGILFLLFSPTRSAGRILSSLAAVLWGLEALQKSLVPLARSAAFQVSLGFLQQNPFYGVAGGFFLTTLVLSSTVTIGILQSLRAARLLTLSQALPVLYGDNIGTTTDALLASLATGPRGRQLALFHFAFNALATLLFLPLSSWLGTAVAFLTSSPKAQIAWAHTLFNLVGGAVLLPFRHLLLGAIARLIRTKEE